MYIFFYLKGCVNVHLNGTFFFLNALNINQSYDRYSSILQTSFKVADIKF